MQHDLDARASFGRVRSVATSRGVTEGDVQENDTITSHAFMRTGLRLLLYFRGHIQTDEGAHGSEIRTRSQLPRNDNQVAVSNCQAASTPGKTEAHFQVRSALQH